MTSVLIVGAGPVGMVAALELARLTDYDITLIDKSVAPSPLSRAIAIHARTLSLLEASGVSEQLLARGNHLHFAEVFTQNKSRLRLDFSLINHRYDFILALPQDQTEMILAEALAKRGVQVQRGCEFSQLLQQGDKVLVTVKQEGNEQQQHYDYVIGADGAHSDVRKAVGMNFLGFQYPGQWHIADVHMSWSFSADTFRLFSDNRGKVLVVAPLSDKRYRLISTHDNAIDSLPKGSHIQETLWQSHFAISCRQVACYQKGRVFLAGDAAHIHSPAGGRGMNLGIEDACNLVHCFSTADLADYNRLRHPAGVRVMQQTDRLFRTMTATQTWQCWLRDYMLFPLLKPKFIQKQLLNQLAGL